MSRHSLTSSSLVGIFLFLFPLYVNASWFGRAAHQTVTLARIAKASGRVDILMVDDEEITTVDVPSPSATFVVDPPFMNITIPVVTVPVGTGTAPVSILHPGETCQC